MWSYLPFFSHTQRATDDCSTNLSRRPRPLLFLLHNYLRSLSFLLPSVLLHLSPSSLLSSQNLWAAPLSPSLILHIPACLPPGWLWNRPGREGEGGVCWWIWVSTGERWSTLTPEQVLQLPERIFYRGRLFHITPAERKNESVRERESESRLHL